MPKPSFGSHRPRKSRMDSRSSQQPARRHPHARSPRDTTRTHTPYTRSTTIARIKSRKNSAIAQTQDHREILIPSRDASVVRAGDLVEIGDIRSSYDRLIGRIIHIRSTQSSLYRAEIIRVSGRYQIIRLIDLPYDSTMRLMGPSDLLRALAVGDIIEVTLDLTHTVHPQEATFSRRVAQGDDPERFLIFARSTLDLPRDFSPKVITTIPHIDITSELSRRVDYREHIVWSVDSEDARDLDDALSIETHHDGGYTLFVHIADVSSYVPQGSVIDHEASERGTSIYLPEAVIPMLPEELSNHLCSLNTDGDKLTITAVLTYDIHGHLCHTEVHPSVIRSKWRGTYTAVGAYIQEIDPTCSDLPTQPSPSYPPPELHEPIGAWYQLCKLLFAHENQRGKLEFESDELRVIRAADEGIFFAKRERHIAHRMIEVAMIAANEAVAKYLKSHHLLTPARIHEPPSEEKIAMYLELESAYIPKDNRPKSQDVTRDRIRAFLHRIASHPASAVLERKILSTLSKAYYSHLQSGHFGLALSDYIHFTSPIRRYPDLLAHRILHAHWRGDGHAYRDSRKLESLLERSSERERVAISAERSLFDRYRVEYFRRRVGESYSAIVTGILPSVIFVEVDPGLEVSLEQSSSALGSYHLGPLTRVMGTLSLGDKVTIEIISVDDVLVRVEGALVIERAKKKP